MERSSSGEKSLPWYLDLAFLIREVPGILGERSIQGAIESALTSGGVGHAVPSSDAHHGHWIERLGLDLPQNHVQKARNLQRVWDQLFQETKNVLDVYYTPRVVYPEGFDSFIGSDLASVALAFPPDSNSEALREACKHASKHKKLILRARSEATKRIIEAHEEWDRVRRIVDPTSLAAIKRKARMEMEAELA